MLEIALLIIRIAQSDFLHITTSPCLYFWLCLCLCLCSLFMTYLTPCLCMIVLYRTVPYRTYCVRYLMSLSIASTSKHDTVQHSTIYWMTELHNRHSLSSQSTIVLTSTPFNFTLEHVTIVLLPSLSRHPSHFERFWNHIQCDCTLTQHYNVKTIFRLKYYLH